MKKNIEPSEVKTIIENIPKGAFFSVEFIKKDNTYRKMTCRFGVKSKLNPHPIRKKPEMPDNYRTVYDINAKGYRHINLETILTICTNHIEYEVI